MKLNFSNAGLVKNRLKAFRSVSKCVSKSEQHLQKLKSPLNVQDIDTRVNRDFEICTDLFSELKERVVLQGDPDNREEFQRNNILCQEKAQEIIQVVQDIDTLRGTLFSSFARTIHLMKIHEKIIKAINDDYIDLYDSSVTGEDVESLLDAVGDDYNKYLTDPISKMGVVQVFFKVTKKGKLFRDMIRDVLKNLNHILKILLKLQKKPSKVDISIKVDDVIARFNIFRESYKKEIPCNYFRPAPGSGSNPNNLIIFVAEYITIFENFIKILSSVAQTVIIEHEKK